MAIRLGRFLLIFVVTLIAIPSFAEEEFDPFPQNRGTIYEYTDEDVMTADMDFIDNWITFKEMGCGA